VVTVPTVTRKGAFSVIYYGSKGVAFLGLAGWRRGESLGKTKQFITFLMPDSGS
jgi:hypothetical protein